MAATAKYSAVPTAVPTAEHNATARHVSLFHAPGWVHDFFQGKEHDDHAAVRHIRGIPGTNNSFIQLKVNVESWRAIAYLNFWFFAALAIVISYYVVNPILKEGPTDGNACPPFETGEGFDLYTNSHLVRAFGYNNICSNWDYSPAREIIAAVYPAFEYSLIIYLCLDFAQCALSYQRGYVTRGFWFFCKIAFPIQVFLAAEFRLMFVMLAYENVQGHTAGFLGLQIALILVAIQNTLYVLETGTAYNFVGGLRNTRILAWTYLSCNLVISAIKIYLTQMVVLSGKPYDWSLLDSPIPGNNIAEFVDIFWMLFNALLPLIICIIRTRSEKPMIVYLTMDSQVHP